MGIFGLNSLALFGAHTMILWQFLVLSGLVSAAVQLEMISLQADEPTAALLSTGDRQRGAARRQEAGYMGGHLLQPTDVVPATLGRFELVEGKWMGRRDCTADEIALPRRPELSGDLTLGRDGAELVTLDEDQSWSQAVFGQSPSELLGNLQGYEAIGRCRYG